MSVTDQRRIWTRKEWLCFVYGATHQVDPTKAEAAVVELMTLLAVEAAYARTEPRDAA